MPTPKDKSAFGNLPIPLSTFISREHGVREIQGLLSSNREIAEMMTVGVKTVETYITRILNKLGFDSRVKIATWVVEKGLGAPIHDRKE